MDPVGATGPGAADARRSGPDRSRLPNLVMAGPGKAGTTSLYWYLSQHPEICPADVKEIKYFAPIAHGETDLPPLETYAAHFAHWSGEPFRLEASPQYFHGGAAMVDAMRAVLDRPRVLLTLRDPGGRLWSIYRSLKVRRTIPETMSFETYLDECERIHRAGAPLSRENRPFWTVSGSLYLEYVRTWLAGFGQDCRVVFFENLTRDPPSEVAGICRWLGIDEAVAATFSYTVENRTVANRSRLLHRIALAANREGVLRDRRRLKAPLRRAYYALNRSPRAERMDPATRDRLAGLFGAANLALGAELRALGYSDLPAWLSSESPDAPA